MRGDRPSSDPSLRFLCREVELGWHGEASIDDRDIRLRLVDFGEEWAFDVSQKLRCELEDGSKATFLNCAPLLKGQGRLEVISGRALVGKRFWTDADRVRRVRFSFWGDVDALTYDGHLEGKRDDEELVAGRLRTFLPSEIDYAKLDIFRASTDLCDIDVWLGLSQSFDHFEPSIRFRPIVRVEFREDQTLEFTRRFLNHVVAFFELSLGSRSRPFGLVVSPLSSAQRDAAMRTEERDLDEFIVREWWGDWQPDDYPTSPGRRVIFPVFEEDDRKKAARAMEAWIERLTEWEPTYALAARYFAHRGPFDRDRLLRLASWFESFPVASRKSDVTKLQRKALIQAAQVMAGLMNRSDLLERIARAIDALAYKSLKTQLKDTAAALRHRFGRLVPADVEADLDRAADLRNDAAHGRVSFDDDHAVENIRAIRALELVCLLQMIDGFELSPSLVDAVYNHSMGAYLLRLE